VDALWLSPFYPSALADRGYDVDDYRDVDARLGTLETSMSCSVCSPPVGAG